jgi:large subunit ribosomal protein L20
MPRVRKGAAKARKHRKLIKLARGYRGAGSRRYHMAIEVSLRAGRYATYGRKLRKRDFRSLWITRISAACRQRGWTYSRFMNALAARGILINRKMLAELAVADPAAFEGVASAAGLSAAVAAAPA